MKDADEKRDESWQAIYASLKRYLCERVKKHGNVLRAKPVSYEIYSKLKNNSSVEADPVEINLVKDTVTYKLFFPGCYCFDAGQ